MTIEWPIATEHVERRQCGSLYPEIDIPAPKRMENTPEGREQKLQRALERLQTIQPSDVTELTRSWLEEILDRGAPYATTPSVRTAGGGRLISPSSEDKGPIYTPPYSDANPVRLDNDQVIWLRPSPSRSPQGYKPIVVLDKQ